MIKPNFDIRLAPIVIVFTRRRGHWGMFWLGFIVFIVWLFWR
jgi:hypothetical protein